MDRRITVEKKRLQESSVNQVLISSVMSFRDYFKSPWILFYNFYKNLKRNKEENLTDIGHHCIKIPVLPLSRTFKSLYI